jgi:hypothetical protein
MSGGVELDMDVMKALRWLAETTTDPQGFSERLEVAQDNYIKETSKKVNFGTPFDKSWYGDDVVAGFFASEVFN